ncbi:phosphomannomutase [Gammaproteobacteria bacterium]
MPSFPSCFLTYDIRGRVPDELNEDLAYRIGRAYATFVAPRCVAVGHDIRLTSPVLASALIRGLIATGVDVVDIGLCGTEEIYFATFHQALDGGIMVTASHNPMDYNGMKLVRADARPISSDSGLHEIRTLVENDRFSAPTRHGNVTLQADKSDYIAHLLSYINREVLRPLKIVVNSGNGCAGPVLDLLEPYFPFSLIKLHHTPNGCFPNGIPNPLLPENRAATAQAVQSHGADLGLAWDGDFDRCFFFDEHGHFIEGYYLVGLLAQALLERHPGGKIIHDPRLVWNTHELTHAAGGIPLQCKTGHAFIKERMRAEDAIYGGEMSAHHYFRDFSYCDSGMIPWLLVAERLCISGRTLSSLGNERIAAYPCSGEINFRIKNPQHVIETIAAIFAADHPTREDIDGISLEFADWRFNLRASNTEPLVRLNIETHGNATLLQQQTERLRALITEKIIQNVK